MTASSSLLELLRQPTHAGKRALDRRSSFWSEQIRVLGVPEHPVPSGSAIVRRGDLLQCDAHPAPETLHAGDQLLLREEPEDSSRLEYLTYLEHFARAAPADCELAPFSSTPAGLHPLWCIAVARILLPRHHRVQARHDLLGIRLAQVALGFGADTLAGPTAPERVLPLAGITRPNEHSLTGLCTLVQQAGFVPVTTEPKS